MSAPIQRIMAAAVNAVAESSFSLANLNLDFSLVTYIAPAELQPLGQRLSKARRQSAEEGSFHILATRLGALFDDVLPDVPALLEAYGTRASEIVQEVTDTLQNPKSIAEGFFGSHLGIDCTTIWASATSGKSVLRIHLLACMLARIWSPQEATAIWAELVNHRQLFVKQQAKSGDLAGNYLAQLAALHEIDRTSLARWDASARAWLQVADRSRNKQQIQVQLIVNNLSIEVKYPTKSNRESTLTNGDISYKSVITNVSGALTTLDRLIKGEPQRITDGGILLGLTSWHLYPDLVVLGSETKETSQKDPLVQDGGIVTISIAPRSGLNSAQDGVYWSLPLSGLRYYGTVECERSTMHDSRLSLAQLQALAFGASLDSLDIALTAAKILRSLWMSYYKQYRVQLHDSAKRFQERPDEFLYHNTMQLNQRSLDPSASTPFAKPMKVLQLLFPFMDGIDLLFSDDESEKKTAIHLMGYGVHKGRSWIGNTGSMTPFFGLTDLQSLIRMITGSEARIEFLRMLCAQNSLDPKEFVIRFPAGNGSWAYVSVSPEETCESAHAGAKRKRSEYESKGIGDIRCLQIPPDERWVCFARSKQAQTAHLDAFRPDGHRLTGLRPDAVREDGSHPDELSTEEFEPNETQPDQDYIEDSPIYGDIFQEFLQDPSLHQRPILFDFVMGDHSLAAVYVRRQGGNPSPSPRRHPNHVPLDIVHDLITRGLLSLDTVSRYLLHHFEKVDTTHGFALLALGRIMDYYKRFLPHTTVSISVIKRPISSWSWVLSVVQELQLQQQVALQQARDGYITESIYPSPLSREQAFAAIIQFESGTVSVDTQNLTRVMAISSGNSLFIAKRLLHDPIPPSQVSYCAVAHVLGNVGKPGISLLIAPSEVEIRKHDINRWRVVNYHPFDGSPSRGMFEGTSLHMSFTGWEGPVNLESSRDRDMEAYYLETKVSMNDKGEWIADLDILKGLADSRVSASGLDELACGHDSSFANADMDLVSIDCWEEILDPPTKVLVLRSGSSWMARLAAVSIASSRQYQCVCLPTNKKFCWTCVINKLPTKLERAILLVY